MIDPSDCGTHTAHQTISFHPILTTSVNTNVGNNCIWCLQKGFSSCQMIRSIGAVVDPKERHPLNRAERRAEARRRRR